VLGGAVQQGFSTPNDEIVQHHATVHDHIQAQIELPNPPDPHAPEVGGERRIDVNLSNHKLLTNPRVALTAGFDQIRAIDRRPGITRGENVVDAMTTGTVRHGLSAKLRV